MKKIIAALVFVSASSMLFSFDASALEARPEKGRINEQKINKKAKEKAESNRFSSLKANKSSLKGTARKAITTAKRKLSEFSEAMLPEGLRGLKVNLIKMLSTKGKDALDKSQKMIIASSVGKAIKDGCVVGVGCMTMTVKNLRAEGQDVKGLVTCK